MYDDDTTIYFNLEDDFPALNREQEIKVLEKCTKNLIGHSGLASNNHESNIDC